MLNKLKIESLSVPDNLHPVNISISNDYLYFLLDELKIGWHYDWEIGIQIYEYIILNL